MPRELIDLINKHRDPTLSLREYYSAESIMEKKINKAESDLILSRQAAKFSEVVTKALLDKKFNLRAYLRTLIDNHMNENMEVEIDEVKAAVDLIFKDALLAPERLLLKNGLDSKGTVLTVNELREKLLAGISDESDRIRLHVQVVSMILDKRGVNTGRTALPSR